MPDTQTPHYSTWIKPEVGGDATVWGNVLNTTFDAIDEVVWTNQGNLALYLPLTGGTITGSLVVGTNISAAGTATFGSVSTGAITASGAISAASVTASGAVNAATVTASGAISSASLTASGPITTSGTVQGAAVISTGDISASGNINTGNNVNSNSVTTNQVTTGGATWFFHNTYSDFGMNINPANNSRWLQFATGWSIQAIVNNSAYYFYIGGNEVATLDYQGNLVIHNQGYKPGGGAWAASSDERVKRDIEPYQRGLAELNQLEPVSFAYNGKGGTEDDGKRYVGLIAQMAQQAMPSLVHELPGEFEGKLDGQLGVDTSELVYTLLNAVKELAARVAELEAAR